MNWLGYDAVKGKVEQVSIKMDISKLKFTSLSEQFKKDLNEEKVKAWILKSLEQEIRSRIDYLTDKKKLVAGIEGRLPEDLNRNLNPFNISIRSTLAGITAHSMLTSAAKVTVKEKNIYLDFSPLSIGICTDTIYKKLKSIKHTNAADIKAGSSDFMQILMD